MALVLTPRSIAPESSADTVEVKVGETSEQPGDATTSETAKPTEPQAQAAPAPVAKVEKPVAAKPVAVKAAPAPKKAAVAKPLKAKKATIAAVAKPSDDPEAPVVNEEKNEKAPVETAATEEVLTPVKETAPAGVEAAQDTETLAEAKPEVKKEEPAAKPVETAPVVAAAPVAAATGAGQAKEQGVLNKGGATQAEAVSYLDLKQLPGNKLPTYPMQARLEKRQGTLELTYRVTKDGKVTDIQIKKSSGSKDLDDSAIAAISTYKFVPGQEGWASHPVVFNLKGAVAIVPSKLRLKNSKQAVAE